MVVFAPRDVSEDIKQLSIIDDTKILNLME